MSIINNIQTGSVTLDSTSAAGGITNVTITSVDLSRTWVTCTLEGNSPQPDDYFIRYYLSSQTNLRIEVYDETGGKDVRWQVIEFTEASGVRVQTGSFDDKTGSEGTHTLTSAVTVSSSHVDLNYLANDAGGSSDEFVYAYVQDSNTLGVYEGSDSGTARYYQVVDWGDNATVQIVSGTFIGGTDYELDLTIPNALNDYTNCIVIGSSISTGYLGGNIIPIAYPTDSTTLKVTRQENGTTVRPFFQVIEFPSNVANVQQEISATFNSSTTTFSIDEVNTSQSIIIPFSGLRFFYSSNTGDDQVRDFGVNASFNSSTEVQLERESSDSNYITIGHIGIVDFDVAVAETISGTGDITLSSVDVEGVGDVDSDVPRLCLNQTTTESVTASVNIGLIDDDRLVIVTVVNENVFGVDDVFYGDVTIGSITATSAFALQQTAGFGSYMAVYLFDESDLTDTSGTQTVTFSNDTSAADNTWAINTQLFCNIKDKTIVSSGTDNNVSTNTNVQTNINANENGLVWKVVFAGTSVVYSNWTSPLVEIVNETQVGGEYGVAYGIETSGVTNKTYSVTVGATTRNVGGTLVFNSKGFAVATAVSAVSSDKADGTYGLGEEIYISVCFDDQVSVSGIPQLELDVVAGGYKIDYVPILEPNDIVTSGLEGWYDASDLDTISDTSSAVDQWNDKSGNSRHVKQTGSTRPTTNSITQNGLNAIDFDVSNAQLLDTDDAATWLNSTEYTILSVQKYNTSASQGFICGTIGSSPNEALHIGLSPFADEFVDAHYADDGTFTSHTPDGNTHINVVQYKSPGSELWEDGTSIDTDTDPSSDLNTAGVFQVGSGWATDVTSSHSTMDGYICELIVISSAISESDRQKLEGYLAWKWGLVANLPSNHPYKNRPPLAS